jgi:hypothetical protein
MRRSTDRILFPATAVLVSAYFFLLARPSLHSFFTRDDLMNLYRSWSLPAGLLVKANTLFFWASPFYRPLPSLWYRVIFHFAGFHPLPFRVIYLLGFVPNLVLTYSLARRLSGSGEIAAVTTLLASYHYRMNALYFDTAYIYDALCYLFFFSAFLLYVRVRQQERPLRFREISACCLLYICALNSKETAVTLPVFLLVYELLYHPPRWRSRADAGWWTLTEGRGVMLTGAITLLFVAGRSTGEMSLLSIPVYRPVLTWARFMETSRHYLGDIFSDGRDWPDAAVLALWAVLFLVAWAVRSRPLQFAWLFLMISPLPLAFVVPRGPAQYYIPWFGWVLYGSTVLVKSIQSLTRRLPPERIWIRGSALLLCLATLSYAYNQRKGWFSVTSVTVQAPIDRAVMEQLHSLEPNLRRHGRLFFFGDALPMPWVDLFFLVRLSYRDDSLEIDRLQDQKHAPEEKELAAYDHVFDYRAGQFQELTRPWRREARSFLPTIVLNPNGAEVYHQGWIPVTAEMPAVPGELLTAKATDLGSTEPPVPQGAPFPAEPLVRVAAKLEIRVDGRAAYLVNQVGWPEMVNTYRVDFSVPKETRPGMAKVDITAEGITGPAVTIAIR